MKSQSVDNHLVQPFARAIQEEFLRRCRTNSAYSLRAYARSLQVDQSLLSKILRGKVNASRTLEERLSPRLGEAVVARQLKDDSDKDELALLSHWIHFAIFEFVKLKGADVNAAVIAKRFGIHREEAKSALETLARLGYCHKNGQGWQFTKSLDHSWTNTARSSEARRRLQIELHRKSLEALEELPFGERDHGSLTLAIQKDRLPELREYLKQVRTAIGQKFQTKSDDLDEVYQLTIGLYPLTKSISPRKQK